MAKKKKFNGELWCCGCQSKVMARLTNGKECYSHRLDLHLLPFWKCDACNNFVGCHHKTSNPTNPLGVIATKDIKQARIHIHKILDPLWESRRYNRKKLYSIISQQVGWTYHTSKIKTIDEARTVYRIVKGLAS